MSEYEVNIGKLRLIPRPEGETLEDQCKRVYLDRHGKPPRSWRGCSFEELLLDRDYGSFVVHEENLYVVLNNKKCDSIDIFEIHNNKDGTYDYTLAYYNGGCCFSEAVGYAFDKPKRSED